VSGLLAKGEAGYEESMEDARMHFEQVMMSGWILRGDLALRHLELRGLELRLTRLLGAPAAKDLTKLDRYLEASAEIWEEAATCECGECVVSAAYETQLYRDGDLRLLTFAQEIRAGRR
jgi:hypothetical protein